MGILIFSGIDSNIICTTISTEEVLSFSSHARFGDYIVSTNQA